MKAIINGMKKPCSECPYTLGLVRTVVNPCPQCKQNGYDAYERFMKQPWQGKTGYIRVNDSE